MVLKCFEIWFKFVSMFNGLSMESCTILSLRDVEKDFKVFLLISNDNKVKLCISDNIGIKLISGSKIIIVYEALNKHFQVLLPIWYQYLHLHVCRS